MSEEQSREKAGIKFKLPFFELQVPFSSFSFTCSRRFNLGLVVCKSATPSQPVRASRTQQS